MNGARALRSVEEHLDAVLDAVRGCDVVALPVEAALGLTLAESVRARVPIPVFDNSAMDGFAVRFDDVARATASSPVALRVVADLPAGSPLDPPLGPGEAARIMTGSAMPTAADTVVPFEDTAEGLADSLGEIRVLRAPRARGVHLRRKGSDLAPGVEVVPAGAALGAFQVGAAAAAGVDVVRVRRRPRVAVISTGSELVAAGAALARGQIPESNSLLLAGLVADAGGELVLRTTVADDDDGLRPALAEARSRGADAVVFSGGVSAGAYEVVKATLGPTGEMAFASVAMQPGKPQGFGSLDDGTLLFGLPGNPVSAAVSFEVFVRPALLLMAGRAELHRPMLRLAAGAGWTTPPGRRQYLPAALDRRDPGAWRVVPATAGGSGSHLAGGLAQAEAFAVVPAEVDRVEPGDGVDVMLRA
ncbi:gephyrin-like molybdotransferase Glp [Microbacterium invictum]|uniref:Molybdopterin molybdenumtransferase n=1 Tax=Microbacterium invictum TaxID=515415 RepID=A0ABZ0VCS2_9MICO|nr:gephyrin-like molybdotransferase Glp [Microbacterium invictum]WQB71408.1 gephyrin-like molybdotransferase Glp [Microbacterium invictum]